MPWREGRGVSWAVEYLRTQHGFTTSQIYRQKLLRWTDAGLVPGVDRDWGGGPRRRARWLYTPEGLDELAAELKSGRDLSRP